MSGGFRRFRVSMVQRVGLWFCFGSAAMTEHCPPVI